MRHPVNLALSDSPSSVATGGFDVKISPPEPVAVAPGASAIGRHAIEKTYHGGLAGHSLGEMLSAGQPQQGKAGYVAIESFEGTLDGRSGGFALAHLGEMDAGSEFLRIGIVPGSGTGELAGIKGQLQIRREAGRHDYTLTYWMA
ncbi:DUF3224 domain-containing protein [Burkholderia gladioli]|uniref:DUF3224 domain-containing protein n=1 Tax=Burkholderia gladioli TaxID=28095 RepID=UPI0028AE99C9|nr:DUF3224 domain-containing protein [Burkholderia gladioli]